MLNLKLTNIYSEGNILYLFHRPDKELSMMKESTFMPYYYEPSESGIFKGYFGERLVKLFCKEPWLIKDKRSDKSCEGDVIYTKRFMIDKLNIEKANVKYIFFDIETKSKNLPNAVLAPDPITCISAWDNYSKEYVTFWSGDYKTEYLLIKNFIEYIKKIKPDLLLGYNALGFDYPYLIGRYPNFAEEISPIGKFSKRNNFPAGISILDYYQLVKKVYRYKRYTLDYVYCDTFKLPFKPQKYDFYNAGEEIKEKNIFDVRKLVELEDKLHLITYFDELRRLSKVLWEDLCMYSVLVDGFILQIAKEKGVILPTKPDENEKVRRQEEDEITGGYVYAKPGLHEGVQLFDIGGTYPNLIRTFCIDPSNKRKESGINTVKIKNINIAQNTDAIVPTVCNRLINSRQEIQKQLETVTGEEAELLKKKDDAHKSLNNTVYGVLLFKSSRLYDKDIGGVITYLARFLIRYTIWWLRMNKIEIVAGDTDSVFIKTNLPQSDIENKINNIIIPNYLKHFGKTEGTLKFKYEGNFRNLLILSKKHYCGNFITSTGEEKLVKKGIEALRSDSSKFQEQFQEELLTKILAKESKESIMNWIKSEIERMKTLPLTDISFPCKLSKEREDYKTEAIHVRALRYAQALHPEWEVNIGQTFFYCFIVPKEKETKKAMRKVKGVIKEIEVSKDCNIMAFDEFSTIDFEIDYSEMVERNIMKKCATIFDALQWDLKDII